MKFAVDCFQIEKPVAFRFRLPGNVSDEMAYEAVGHAVTKALNAADWPFLWKSDGGAGFTSCALDEEDAEAVNSVLENLKCTEILKFEPLPGKWDDGDMLVKDEEGNCFFVHPMH